MASSRGDIEGCKAILEARGTDLLHEKDREGLVALLRAIQFDRAATVEFLISQGADINCLGPNLETALHIACKFQAIHCISFIIDQAGPEILSKGDTNGWSPLHYCAIYGSSHQHFFLFPHSPSRLTSC